MSETVSPPRGADPTKRGDATVRPARRRLAAASGVDVVFWSALAVLAILLGAALVGPVLVSTGASDSDLANAFIRPGASHLLGTDEQGRDVFARLVVGARAAVSAGIVAVAVGLLGGLPLGLAAGYLRGWWDEVISGFIEILMSMPTILLAMLLVAVLGPSRRNVIIAVGVASMPHFARLVRGVSMALREEDYVAAARQMGAGAPHIMFTHIVRGALPTIIVAAVLSTGTAIVSVAGLSFLGLGGDPRAADWGLMLRQGLQYLYGYPYLSLAPAAPLCLFVLSINIVGERLADRRVHVNRSLQSQSASS